jgi:hypothetical protein
MRTFPWKYIRFTFFKAPAWSISTAFASGVIGALQRNHRVSQPQHTARQIMRAVYFRHEQPRKKKHTNDSDDKILCKHLGDFDDSGWRFIDSTKIRILGLRNKGRGGAVSDSAVHRRKHGYIVRYSKLSKPAPHDCRSGDAIIHCSYDAHDVTFFRSRRDQQSKRII